MILMLFHLCAAELSRKKTAEKGVCCDHTGVMHAWTLLLGAIVHAHLASPTYVGDVIGQTWIG